VSESASASDLEDLEDLGDDSGYGFGFGFGTGSQDRVGNRTGTRTKMRTRMLNEDEERLSMSVGVDRGYVFVRLLSSLRFV